MNLQDIKFALRKEMSEQPKMKVLAFWLFCSALGIISIKTIIRPRHLQLSDSFIFLQGTLPNFFAGAMFCVLAFVYYGALSRYKVSTVKKMLFAFLFSFVGLTLWECIQYFMGYSIDYYDILMTAGGNLLTVFLIILLRIK